ncbi:MAG: bi-domain-containing oxidoreductase [Proteobacteria bacterium]|nr:bi-domain-containing oxidoreductase [Pseudomonadota bacterium]
MKQVIQSARSGKLALVEVPAPRVKRNHLLVRTTASLISAGTERMVVEFARQSLVGKARSRPDLVQKVLTKVRRDGIAATLRQVRARLDEPLPLGYSAAGVVVEVGGGLEGAFRVGQRVALAGAGIANHAEFNLVPRNLAAPIPDEVSDEEAAFGTLGAIALHGVRHLSPGLGDVIAVLGVGLVGQLAVQLLALSGARVIAIDSDSQRLDLARRMGAELTLGLAQGGLAQAVLAFTEGRNADGILIAAASESNEPFLTAAAIARDRAKISLVGKIGTEFPFGEFMKKELSVVVSRSYGPGRYDDEFETQGLKYPIGFVRWTETDNLAECLRLMRPGARPRLNVGALITHRFEFSQAEAAYTLVVDRTEPHLGVVLKYPEMAASRPLPPAAARRAASGNCVIGMIGAGAFARGMLLPLLKDIPGVALKTLVTSRGMTAEHNRESHGFINAATDPAAIFDDAEINAVIIATPHGSHAELTARGLQAGKNVFVEKPLALTREELNRVIAAREASTGFLLVGFNRRFAPMAVSARDALAARPGPRFLLLRVNAGPLPRESWIAQDSEGRGRILGELCHFVDLAQYLAGAPIRRVQAAAARATGPADDVAVTLDLADGSLATIAYTGLGDPSFPKEHIEGYAAGTVVRIEDFRDFTRVVDGKETRETSRLGQDKGHKAELAAFVNAVKTGGKLPADEAELVASSLATIAVLEALSTGAAVNL